MITLDVLDELNLSCLRDFKRPIAASVRWSENTHNLGGKLYLDHFVDDQTNFQKCFLETRQKCN